jgi:hypothetical protein
VIRVVTAASAAPLENVTLRVACVFFKTWVDAAGTSTNVLT